MNPESPDEMVRYRPLTLNDPSHLGDYELLGVLGEGGMGVVYLGRGADGREVAIKAIHRPYVSSPEFVRRFRREVEAARRVPRYCTAAVLDADLDAPAPFLVTEYVDGPSLDEAVAEHGPMAGAGLSALAVGTAAALTAIHEVGVIHRDLKPGNVLLSSAGPRVIDFGIASAAGTTSHTLTGQFLGTPAYMAPEQIAGERATPAADIFAWGGVVVFAANGLGAFGQPTNIPAMMHRILHESPQLDALEPGLRAMVADALAKDPARRPTAAALLHQLRLYVDQGAPGGTAAHVIDLATRTPGRGAPIPAAVTSLPHEGPTIAPPGRPLPAPPRSTPRRGRLVVALAVAAVLAVTAGAAAVADPFDWRDDATAASDDPGPGDQTDGQESGATTTGPTDAPTDPTGSPSSFTLPDYVGEDATSAQAALEGERISVQVESEPSGVDRAGRVLRVSKPEGSVLQAGDRITIVVGDGNGRAAVYTRIGGSEPINDAGIFVRSADGSERRVGTGSSPDISADGKRIVYIELSPDFRGQVHTARADGRGSRQITDITVGSVKSVALSPDGRRIAYSNNTGGVYVVDIDGGGKRLVADVDAFEMDWSPDGRSIVFRRYDTTSQQLWVVGADGTGLRHLPVRVSGDGVPAFPSWSPDGTTIAFSTFGAEISVVPAGGGRTRTIATGSSPSWTADGQVSFLSGTQVKVINPNGDGEDTVPGLSASDPVRWAG